MQQQFWPFEYSWGIACKEASDPHRLISLESHYSWVQACTNFHQQIPIRYWRN